MKNKNKKFLFLYKNKRGNKKNEKDIFKTFVASVLVVTITSSFFSFLDYKISRNITNNPDSLKTSNLPSTEDILNKILVINEVGAANINYKASSFIPSSKISLEGNVGEIITFPLKLKNIGNYVWRQSGVNQIVLRVKDNKNGLLKSDKWISNSVVAKLKQTIVYVGETGEFNVSVKVPSTTSSDTYVLYVGSYSQEVPGSYIEFTVSPKDNIVSSSVAQNSISSVSINTNNILSKSYNLYDSSPEIKKLQQFLNNNGFTVASSGVGSKGRETEYFGPATQKALINFQKKNNLSNSGKLTDETVKFINNFGSNNKSDIDVNNQVVIPSNTNTNNILSKSYNLYDSSPEIKKLQQFLNNNGFTVASSGVGSKGRETEYFGPATQKALINFQKKNNLSNSGKLTDETVKFINNFGSNNVTAQTEKDDEMVLENISYISSDKDFEIVDSKTLNTVLNVKSGEKVNISFNQVTKTYTVSKDGLIYYNSNNKLNIKNTNSGSLDLGGKKYTNLLIALKSDFDIKVNNNSNGFVVCASIDCGLVDNNTNPAAVDNSTSNIPTNTSSITTSNGTVIKYLNHEYIKDEFKIRVGISRDLLPATITNNQNYSIVDGNNVLITQVNSGEQVIINYNKSTKIYSVMKNGVLVKETYDYLKLDNINNGIFTINNMVLSPYGVNYNMFKGNLELRYNSTYDHAWIINELGMEDYLKGIGEASNSSSYEYLKVMAVTARTYATYHYLNSSKNAAQYFNVFSTTADQVYYGYRREISQPNVVKAVDETRGMYITYNDKIIQAFYSANAGGKTRTVYETWGGSNLPYLIPVEDKYTKNDVRFGHGVGMSQVGAIRMIAYDNADFVKVLTYYYNGVEVERLY